MPLPLLQMAGHGGHREYKNSNQETDQTVLTITKALTKTTVCAFRAKKWRGATQKKFSGAFFRHSGVNVCKTHTHLCSFPVNTKLIATFQCAQVKRTDGRWYWAEYSSFSVSDEVGKYQLNVDGFSGDTDNALMVVDRGGWRAKQPEVQHSGSDDDCYAAVDSG